MLGHSAKSITINQRSSISLPVTLRWNQIRIRPTRNGFIFIFLVLSMLLGSINYINNLGFLLTFLLGSIAFVSIANTYKNIAGITIRSSFSRPSRITVGSRAQPTDGINSHKESSNSKRSVGTTSRYSLPSTSPTQLRGCIEF